MTDIELIIKMPEEIRLALTNNIQLSIDQQSICDSYIKQAIINGTPLPKGHGRLKDEDEIVKAIEDRVEFLRKNDAVFMRMRKDIDILGCIPKIRCEVSTIIEADKGSEE